MIYKNASLELLKIFLLTSFLFAVGCVHIEPPLLEYTLADTALSAAKNVQAIKYAPKHWTDALEAYRQAQILFNEREYEQAKDLFNRARLAAEKAELSARLAKQRNGDIL